MLSRNDNYWVNDPHLSHTVSEHVEDHNDIARRVRRLEIEVLILTVAILLVALALLS